MWHLKSSIYSKEALLTTYCITQKKIYIAITRLINFKTPHITTESENLSLGFSENIN